ncbi:MAG: phosphoenolpyruvate--protein phosphotransferase [Chromatiales bacterium]|nr:phosphoenolpyruvate--protein phosphotransferase [Gammaproteobacteria bacterium]MCP5353077.1 phosphoenolpyruvate--protein phosphotransferase [Chromatiales bacterium]
MTLALHGIGVSAGIASGPVHVLHRELPEVPYYPIAANAIDTEVTRYRLAVDLARTQLRAVGLPAGTPSDIAEFIETHLLMLDDVTLSERPLEIIRAEGCNAEWALKLQCDALCRVFDEMDDPYLRTRRDDVAHVVTRIQLALINESPQPHETETDALIGHIVVADDLSPADVVLLQQRGIAGFVTEFGGPLSHSAILARNLGLPAVVGVHGARGLLDEDEIIILDGGSGILLANADERAHAFYDERARARQRSRDELASFIGTAAVTRDGQPVELMANIELREDLDAVRASGRHGIGLYRTEFLYMNRPAPPTEEEHLAAYRAAVEALDGETLTVRTMDLGADKQIGSGRSVASNPALGLRGIRLCLNEPNLFLPQVRAILRASVLGPVEIMVPMISSLTEIQQVQNVIELTKQSLARDGLPYDPNIRVGGMIEVPAAALCADVFAEYLDFLSIGTNDLIQYTLAIDRVDDEVNYLYDALNPGVLKLIQGVIEAGERAGIPVSMCGEMAGDARYTRLLLGMGLRRFSMHPSSLLEIKRVITECDCRQLREQVPAVVREGRPEKLRELMNNLDRVA